MLRIYLHMNHFLFVSTVHSLYSFSIRGFLIVNEFYRKFKTLEIHLKISSLIVKRNHNIEVGSGNQQLIETTY